MDLIKELELINSNGIEDALRDAEANRRVAEQKLHVLKVINLASKSI